MKSQVAPRLFSPELVRVVAKSDKAHWESIYANGYEAVSWFQARPDLSLYLIKSSGIAKDAGIIDVGGGASSLVDYLLDEGYSAVAVLDISPTALWYARNRLGTRVRSVNWFEADVTTFHPPRRFGLWHDRAVFHFLTEAAQRRAYVRTLRRTLAPDGTAIIATFAIDGPTRCSGLPAESYDAEKISAEVGPEFLLIDEMSEVHRTPSGNEQVFTYFHFCRGTTSDALGHCGANNNQTKLTNHENLNQTLRHGFCFGRRVNSICHKRRRPDRYRSKRSRDGRHRNRHSAGRH
jgi:SAM-dependent methyltransferase